MTTDRVYQTATLLQNSQVLVAGGNSNGAELNSAELYDPSTATWTATGSMATARFSAAATLLQNGQVLVVGGRCSSSTCPLASAELYNPSTGTWTTTGSMATSRKFHTVTLLPDGQVLAAGGADINDNIVASAELYDPNTGTWTATGSMANARAFHSATLLSNGNVLVAGGCTAISGYRNCASPALSSAELYDPSTGTWTPTGSLTTARSLQTATLLANGVVLVAGGQDTNGGSTSSAELYDPNAGTWTATGSMTTARAGHTATLLTTGQVLLAGGDCCGSAELYDPNAGTWTATGSMTTARAGHTATLLTTGQVLAAGGCNGGSCTSAELYTYSGTPPPSPPIGGPPSLFESLGGWNPSEIRLCLPCLLAEIAPAAASAAQAVATNSPVNTATGDFYHTFNDLAIPGRGLPINFTHTYNSLTSTTDGPLGFGWTFSYGAFLTKDPSTGAVTVTQEDGSQVTFALSGTAYTAAPRVVATLVKNGDGSFTFTRDARQNFTFNAAGHLTAEQDLNGYTTNLGYNSSGQLSTITDPAGRSLTVGWTGTHITSVADQAGREVLFSYNDGQGNLTEVTDVNKGVTHFKYDANHLLRTMTDPRGGVVTNVYNPAGQVVSQTDPMNRTTGFTYTVDATGAQTTTITDPKGNMTVEQYLYGLRMAVTKGYGTPQAATWLYTYDPATLGITSITDPNGHVTSMTYDANANLLSQTDPLGRTTSYAYDALNDTTAITDPLGTATTMTYDANGNLLSVTKPVSETQQGSPLPPPAGLANWWSGDGHAKDIIGGNNGTWVNGASYALGEVGQAFNFNGVSSYVALSGTFGGGQELTVDAWVKPTAQTGTFQAIVEPADLAFVHLQLNSSGNIAVYTDAGTILLPIITPTLNVWTHIALSVKSGATTLYENGNVVGTSTQAFSFIEPTSTLRIGSGYGGGRFFAGNVDEVHLFNRALSAAEVQAIYTAGSAGLFKPPVNAVTTYSYDPAHPGDLIAVTDPNGNTSTFAYDTYGNRVRSSDPLSDTTTYSYDLIGRNTSMVSPKGNVSGVNPISYTTTMTYDAFGNTTAITDPLGHATFYQYDPNQNLVAMTDALKHTTRYGYDADNEQTVITQTNGTILTTGFDANGNMTSQTDALSRTTIYGYDPLNRVITTTDPLSRTTTYGYDPAGNRTSLLDAMNRTTLYGYDPANELTAITYSDGTTPNVAFSYTLDGQRATMADGTGLTSYGYDSLNRVITSTNGAGQTVGYGYDLAGNLTVLTYPGGSQAVARSYDAANRMVGVTDWLSHTTGFKYDANNNLTTQTYPNTTTATFGYNTADQLTGIVDRRPSGPFWTFEYGRDALGQLKTSADSLEGLNHTYYYTPLNQLAADAQTSGARTRTATWTNDSAYQVRQMVMPTGPTTNTLIYDSAAEVGLVQTHIGSRLIHNFALTYNPDGDRTSQVDSVSGSRYIYGYDQSDRLITATVGLTQASYAYNGDGLRMSKTVTGKSTMSTTFTWDTSDGLSLMLQNGAMRYVTGPSGLPLEQVASNGTVLYYYQDQLGSTRGLLNGASTVVATYSYDPYGNITSKTGTVTTPFSYAGQYSDAETGLQYLRARYYDLNTAQFIAPDPLQSYTRLPYTYVVDNPLNNYDPSGQIACISAGTYGPLAPGQAYCPPTPTAIPIPSPLSTNPSMQCTLSFCTYYPHGQASCDGAITYWAHVALIPSAPQEPSLPWPYGSGPVHVCGWAFGQPLVCPGSGPDAPEPDDIPEP